MSEKMKRILVVEDDYMLNSGLCYNLERDNFQVTPTYNSKLAMDYIKAESFDLIILDVNLPDGNGFDLFKSIKSIQDIPIVFLTACDLEKEVICGFELGADDYITKPFNIHIFRKKVAAVLKRCENQAADNIYINGELSINFNNLSTSIANEPVILTPTEYRILKIFTSNANILLPRQLLLEKLWDCDGNFVDEHTLTVNINRLRSKIENTNRKYIRTIYGMGYLWIGDSE